MVAINQRIKEVIESLIPSTLYLRAAHLEELNIEERHIELGTSVIGINADTPTITYTQPPDTKFTSFLYPVSVYFLMSAEQDQTGDQIDAILDTCIERANQFYDILSGDATEDITEYEIETVIATQVSDDFLTGCRIQFELPLDRETYYCETP